MARMVIVMDPKGLELLDQDIDREVWRLARDIHDDAVRYVPKDTFELMETIRAERRPGLRARVWVGQGSFGDYWATVEYGSRAHVIRPKYKRALHWPDALHPVAKVNHPGTPQQSFMRRALYQQRALGATGRAS